MAFIPDEAVDRMYSKLTSGARDLYTFLCRCRNQSTGKCCPSVSTTQDALKLSRARVFALRRELSTKGWAEFDGNNAIQLFGFGSLKNKTIHELAKEDNDTAPESLKNKTGSLENETDEIEEPQEQDSDSLKNETDNAETATVIPLTTASLKNKTEDADSLENETAEDDESLKNKTKSLKNKTNQSQKQDSPIRKNQQREPAKGTSKVTGAVAPAGSLTRSECYALFCKIRQSVGGYEAPYQDRKADFVQLAELFASCAKTNWVLSHERFAQAAENYFVTPQGSHTLADFASRFSEFYKNALNEFSRPSKVTNSAMATSKFTPNAQQTIVNLEGFVQRNMAKEDV